MSSNLSAGITMYHHLHQHLALKLHPSEKDGSLHRWCRYLVKPAPPSLLTRPHPSAQVAPADAATRLTLPH